MTIIIKVGASEVELNNSQEFTSSGNLIIPEEVNWIFVSGIGAGASGGTKGQSNNAAMGGAGGGNGGIGGSGVSGDLGGGGGGAGRIVNYFPLFVGSKTSVPVVIGSGGSPSTYSIGSVGNTGGITSVDDQLFLSSDGMKGGGGRLSGGGQGGSGNASYGSGGKGAGTSGIGLAGEQGYIKIYWG